MVKPTEYKQQQQKKQQKITVQKTIKICQKKVIKCL